MLDLHLMHEKSLAAHSSGVNQGNHEQPHKEAISNLANWLSFSSIKKNHQSVIFWGIVPKLTPPLDYV